jgi:predicted Zn-dependent protease
MGWKPTGHDFAPTTLFYEDLVNLVVAGGDKTLAQMIKDTREAYLIMGFGYTITVGEDGDTRRGMWKIENGRIVRRIDDLRFNVSVPDLLNHVAELGQPVRVTTEDGITVVVPPMRLMQRAFRFTSRSRR